MSDTKTEYKNPFTVPDNYFESLEDRVRERIRKPDSRARIFIMRVKPALMLTLMFGVIAGFGWIASKVTSLLYTDPADTDDPIMAMIEQGYLESSFIYAYTDDIDVEQAFTYSLENTVTIDGDIEEELEASLTEEDILEYLSTPD